MTSRAFNKGDRVTYTGRRMNLNPEFIGWLGTVVGTPTLDNVPVRWDKFDKYEEEGFDQFGWPNFSKHGHYPGNLAPAEFEYTASQEGDRDDDI